MQTRIKMSEVIARANAINLEKLLLLVSNERGVRAVSMMSLAYVDVHANA